MATLLQIRNRIRQRADMEHTDFVTDAELDQLINTEYAELYGLLVRHSLQRSETVQTITADGSENYDLEASFYSLVGVFRTEGDVRVRLSRHSERFRAGSVNGPATSYRLINFTLELYPRPTSGTYEVVYIPVPAELTNDADTLDGVLGWEEMVVISAAIKCLQKEEAEHDHLLRDKQMIMARIKEESAAVEFTENWVIENVRNPRRLVGGYLEGDYVGRRGLRGWRW